jgi:hypothetical protein
MFWNIVHIPLNEKKSIQKNVRNENEKNFQHILKFHTRPNSDIKVVDYYKNRNVPPQLSL